MSAPEFVLAFESLGVTAEVATDDPALRDRLPEVLPPGARSWETPSSSSVGLRFRLLGRRLARGAHEVSVEPSGVREAVLDLAGKVESHLAQHASGYVFIHAGVVAAGGVGVIIPGHTLSGKTTLVTELVRAGATYYSDEYAVVDAGGAIHPYPRPLALRHDPGLGYPEPPRWHGFPGWIRGRIPVVVPDERVGRAPIRAGLIVVTRYQGGARWVPDEADRGQGALALIEHALIAPGRRGDALRSISRMSEQATVLVGPRGEAAGTARAVLARAGIDGAAQTPG